MEPWFQPPVTPAEEPSVLRAEEIVGHAFRDRTLLAAALRHPSYTSDNAAGNAFQRLEFLGDSVLDMIVVEALYRRFADAPEGDLTKLKVTLVAGPTLADLMRETGLHSVVMLGPSELRTSGRGLTSALADCFEAVVAALYMDAGIESVRSFVLAALEPRIAEGPGSLGVEHPKSALQELAQADGIAPVYETLQEEGPPHERRFTVRVSLDGTTVGEGTGSSKKAAEMQAARVALERLREER